MAQVRISILCLSLLLSLSLNTSPSSAARSLISLRPTHPVRVTRPIDYFAKHPSSSPSSTAQHAAGAGPLFAWPGLGGGEAGPIAYHNGPVLAEPITVHLIYYGSWPAGSGQVVLETFVNSLSSPSADSTGPSVHNWWAISTEYTQSDGRPVSAQVTLGQSANVGGQYSNKLTGDDVANVVSQQITSGALPLDANSFYAVITSADVSIDGFCSSYCGWHSEMTVSGTSVKYALIGDASKLCPGSCGSSAVNGFPGVDAMISVFAHELTETATNPTTSDGWWALDNNGKDSWEDGDVCAWTFTDPQNPTLLQDPGTGEGYNLVGLNNFKFMVQTNADITTQSCILQASSSSRAPQPSSGGVPDGPSPSAISLPPFAPSPESGSPTPATGISPGDSLPSAYTTPPSASLPPLPDIAPQAAAPSSSKSELGSPSAPYLAPVRGTFGPSNSGPASPTGGSGPSGPDPPSSSIPSASPPSGCDKPGSKPGLDPTCSTMDNAACDSCADPEGCFCKDGACLGWCSYMGAGAPCFSCGNSLCTCSDSATCNEAYSVESGR